MGLFLLHIELKIKFQASQIINFNSTIKKVPSPGKLGWVRSGVGFRYVLHPLVELSSRIPTLCSDTQTAAWEHAFQIAHWLLTAMLKPSEGSTGKRRDGTAVVWNNRSNTPTSVKQIPTSIGPKELPSE